MSDKLRNHDELVIDELRNPEMAKSYLEVALEEYELDGDLSFFLEALRNVAAIAGRDDFTCFKNRLEFAEPPSSIT